MITPFFVQYRDIDEDGREVIRGYDSGPPPCEELISYGDLPVDLSGIILIPVEPDEGAADAEAATDSE